MLVKKLVILISVVFSSCVMEPPLTYYVFSIKNNSDCSIYVCSRTFNNDIGSFDTITSGKAINIQVSRKHCYKNYGDTLIHKMFKDFELSSSKGTLVLDPFKRALWAENLDKLVGWRCKSGICTYSLNILNKDIDEREVR
jgi:hypothetical protein